MTEASAALRLLAAEGPVTEHAGKMMTFGQFVGSWDLQVFGYPADGGPRDEYTGEWHFGWVLDGRGVQDVLVVTPLATADGAPQGGKGSTLRVYDPHLDAWWVSWMGPLDREFSTLLARDEGDRIVLEGQWALGQPDKRWRWVFSEIGPDSFRWQCLLDDGTGRERVAEEILATRRAGA